MTVHLLQGDCRDLMRKMESGSVQCCVTSPPYFGLRDYGYEGQLGLEQTPEQYVAAMVEVFRCVRDVLADDGTLWLNLGDSYNAAGRKGHGTRQGYKQGSNRASAAKADNCQPSAAELKPKDLIGIPWRVAFALQADGWYLRQDVIWHKPNPMPESVTDRCTKAHEYLFLLTKSEKYFWDADAMQETGTGRNPGNVNHKYSQDGIYTSGAQKNLAACGARETRNRRSVWTVATRPYKGAHFATFPPALIEPCILAGSRVGDTVLDPFMGSGTTAQVALQHGRRAVGCEMNPEYIALSRQRLGLPHEDDEPW